MLWRMGLGGAGLVLLFLLGLIPHSCPKDQDFSDVELEFISVDLDLKASGIGYDTI